MTPDQMPLLAVPIWLLGISVVLFFALACLKAMALYQDRRRDRLLDLLDAKERRASEVLERAKAAERALEACRAERNRARVEGRREVIDQLAAASRELTTLRALADAAWSVRQGQHQRAHDEREWCAAGQTVSAAEMAKREKILDALLANLPGKTSIYTATEDTGEPD